MGQKIVKNKVHSNLKSGISKNIEEYMSNISQVSGKELIKSQKPKNMIGNVYGFDVIGPSEFIISTKCTIGDLHIM